MANQAIRNLAHLGSTASTARVLNLHKVATEHSGEAEWGLQPMFDSPILNRSLIIKHRLRRNETDLFVGRRQSATKLVIPIDPGDLKLGGRYFFVDQIGFERALTENFALTLGDRDAVVLRLLDRLPSLDPFLLREQLRRGGQDPAACYFSISPSDLKRMSGFVEKEIHPLVALSMERFGAITSEVSVRRLAGKLMAASAGDELEALRQTLRLAPEQYEEGMFCWKGFLYYKWVLTDLLPRIGEVTGELATVRPHGPVDSAARDFIARGREVLRRRILRACDDVRSTLVVYDQAYDALVKLGDPIKFRDFLLQAPAMFRRLGEQLGAIQHIVSFWQFRFGPRATPVTVEELIDIFMDFETGLRGRDDEALEFHPGV